MFFRIRTISVVTIYKCHPRNVGKKYQKNPENTILLVVKDNHLLRGSRIIILEKLSAKELKIILLIYFLILKYLGIRST